MESSGEREKKSEQRRKMENKIVTWFIFCCYFAVKNMKQTPCKQQNIDDYCSEFWDKLEKK